MQCSKMWKVYLGVDFWNAVTVHFVFILSFATIALFGKTHNQYFPSDHLCNNVGTKWLHLTIGQCDLISALLYQISHRVDLDLILNYRGHKVLSVPQPVKSFKIRMRLIYHKHMLLGGHYNLHGSLYSMGLQYFLTCILIWYYVGSCLRFNTNICLSLRSRSLVGK